MPSPAEQFVCAVTGAASARAVETIQELWSGYGTIVRFALDPAPAPPTVVLKHVRPPPAPAHTRAWATDLSHQRKLKSYAVEAEFYRTYALRLPDSVRVPALLAAEDRGGGGERYLLLEDLDAAGYPCRRLASDSDQRDVGACVAWLARFHAAFLSRGASSPAPGLWSVGCYWHLATRPDELAAMPDSALKRAAHAIDARLAACRWATVLHGDAKLANFCFPAGGGGQRRDVAAVDFQYCGGGCGVKDVAYLLGSCFDEDELERSVAPMLDLYFAELRGGSKGFDAEALDDVEGEWRGLWSWAVADFQRFLIGWAPGHWKLNGYGSRLASQVATQCADC